MSTPGTRARPNIVLMMADDMGYSDLGCFGSEIATPNIDSLARRGARFSQFYNCARCCPTRASLLTGLYPHEAGVGHMTTDLRLAGYRGYLSRNAVTIAEALKPAGYTTLMSGKWHVGGDYLLSDPSIPSVGSESWPQPVDRGFDRHFGTLTGAGSYFNPHTLTEDGELIGAQGDFYYTDAIANKAVEYIDEYGAGEDPFFLYVAFTAPHWPLHALEEDIARYRGRYRDGWENLRQGRHEELKGLGILDEQWPISKRDPGQRDWSEVANKDWEDSRMAVYAAQIDRMDQGVGRIVDKLEQMSLTDNTLLMFLSDNGGCAEFLREDGFFEFSPTRTREGAPIKIGNAESVNPGPANTYMSYDLSWAQRLQFTVSAFQALDPRRRDFNSVHRLLAGHDQAGPADRFTLPSRRRNAHLPPGRGRRLPQRAQRIRNPQPARPESARTISGPGLGTRRGNLLGTRGQPGGSPRPVEAGPPLSR